MGKAMYDLRDKLCDELDEIARKPEMGAGDLELAHKLTDTIKNIDKICIMSETGEYSQAGDWEARGRFGDNYARNDGYSERGNSYGRRRDGRYSRDDGRSMRGRSYADGKDGMMEHFRMAMDEADTEDQRRVIRDAMERLKMA